MGTAAYMSPEQARGLAVDARTDVWAFGCVLYEMLTAVRAFPGATVTDVLAAVIEREPDWTRLPATLPSAVRALLQRCLRKDARQRLHDIAGGPLTRLTREGRNSRAIRTPDGKRVVFQSSPGGVGADNLFWMLADGSGSVERLTASTRPQHPSSWSRGGRTLAYVESVPAPSGATRTANKGISSYSYDVLAISLDGNRRPTPILATQANETYPEFSPDGRYLAYVSDESGRNEVWVRPYPGPGSGTSISRQGGYAPAWSQDGRELLYVMPVDSGIRMMAVPITTTPSSLAAGTPSKLFEGRYGMSTPIRGYDVTADGQRFYFTQFKERQPIRATQMILVQNWFEELKAKVPGGMAK